VARKRAPDFDLLALLRGAIAPEGTLKLGPLRDEDKCSGEGSEHLTFADQAIWLDGINPTAEPWVNAVAALDQHDDREPLLTLLEEVVPPDAYPHVADMLVRYRRKRRPTPSYDEPSIVSRLWRATEAVQAGLGITVEQAARWHGLSKDAVRDALAGKRSDLLRAMRKRKRREP